MEKKRSFGTAGGPWEFNLRDLCRWGDLMLQGAEAFGLNPGLYVYLLYAGRMRTNHDKTRVRLPTLTFYIFLYDMSSAHGFDSDKIYILNVLALGSEASG